MRYLYLSRNFNRSGYHILNYLIKNSKYLPVALVLPEQSVASPLDSPATAQLEIDNYHKNASQFGFDPVRFHGSLRRLAFENGIPVLSFSTLKSKSAYESLKLLSPELIVLGGGWPELIPKQIIELPPLGIINTHPSLLPDFRGTDVHRWQIYNGAIDSGTTIHYVDETFDTGPILGQVKIKIDMKDTPQSLAEKAAHAGGSVMHEVLERISKAKPGRVMGSVQDARQDVSRYYSRWRWEDRSFLSIDWTHTAERLEKFVRACTQESYHYNGPYFKVHGSAYILRQASVLRCDSAGTPGQVIAIDESGVTVKCKESHNALKMTQLQPIRLEDWGRFSHDSKASKAAFVANQGNIRVGDNLMVEQ